MVLVPAFRMFVFPFSRKSSIAGMVTIITSVPVVATGTCTP